MVKQLQVIILKNEVFANNHNGFDAIFRVTSDLKKCYGKVKVRCSL